MQTNPTWRTPPKLYREPSKRVLGGVAAGIAEHLRLPVVAVRVSFIVLLAANGLGALLYVAFWGVLPIRPGSPPSPRSARVLLQGAGLIALTAGILVVQYQAGGFGLDATVVALVAVIGLGAGIIWHQADPERRRKLTDELPDGPLVTALRRTTPTPSESQQVGFGERGWFLLRLIGGGGLVVVGIIGVLSFLALRGQNAAFGATITGLFFALLALAGLALALAPLLFRVFGQLREERVARIREQERAEVAAMVHDQVLHTLALIQRRAGDSASVLRLARGQERTLRNWLYKPTGSATERFAAALEEAAAEVEDTYGVSVETVIVGDSDTDEPVHALVAAAREAMVNAARHAKVSSVSLYAEAEEDKLSVFVRDRGPGFDLSTVDDDRHGVRGSIIGRMRRHGGHAEIKTAPGEGTEVELTMPIGRARERNHD
jgi:phage shock protein PspC (stress-responsive transcriptional regulator)/anti-sigma regulatory factor (Ser/Thr protein kinase)